MLTERELLQWLRPADILQYRGLAVIRWKTWADVGHTELYLGDGLCAAARAAGVNTYPFSGQDLVRVCRPNETFDFARMLAFHQLCAGKQKYDWWGLIRVFVLNKLGSPDRAFCSEHVARMCRKENGGFDLVNVRTDCDEVSPRQVQDSPRVTWWDCQEIEVDFRKGVRHVEGGGDLARPAGSQVGHPVGAAQRLAAGWNR